MPPVPSNMPSASVTGCPSGRCFKEGPATQTSPGVDASLVPTMPTVSSVRAHETKVASATAPDSARAPRAAKVAGARTRSPPTLGLSGFERAKPAHGALVKERLWVSSGEPLQRRYFRGALAGWAEKKGVSIG